VGEADRRGTQATTQRQVAAQIEFPPHVFMKKERYSNFLPSKQHLKKFLKYLNLYRQKEELKARN
jgi:histone deacetylase complex regulatory component SIN3